jgi:hypothetical protein
MTHNENLRGAYGMSIRIMDMTATVDVLKEVESCKAKSTVVVKVTEKSPVAGADTTVSFVMQMLVSSMTHLSQTKEVKELACTLVDTIHKNVSKLSYTLFQGSGVMITITCKPTQKHKQTPLDLVFVPVCHRQPRNPALRSFCKRAMPLPAVLHGW